MPRYDSFVVRTWSHGGRLIHGYVMHVASQRQMAFTALERIPDFVQGLLGTGPDTVRPDTLPRQDPEHLRGPEAADAEDSTTGAGQ
jgi:hypothetical protein